METSTETGRLEDQSWSTMLSGYRSGPGEPCSAKLLERLGPWLTNARLRLGSVPPYLDDDDVAQQSVLEVLRIASRWTPGCDDRWIPRRLVEAAERRVRKSLRYERQHLSLELAEDLPAEAGPEPEMVLEIPLGKATASDLRVLYRVKVLGEPVTKLAQEAGISPRQMRQRVRSALERAGAVQPIVSPTTAPGQ